MSEGQENFNIKKGSLPLRLDVCTQCVIDTDNACLLLLHLSETDLRAGARYRSVPILPAHSLAHRCCPVQTRFLASILHKILIHHTLISVFLSFKFWGWTFDG